jgi:hypothetical protein
MERRVFITLLGSCGMAVRGACTATDDAGNRISSLRFTQAERKSGHGIP